MLVTALEANAQVPKLEVVTERLLREERKLKGREGSSVTSDKALATKQKRGQMCYGCRQFGHIKRNCHQSAAVEAEKKSDSSQKKKKAFTQKAHQVDVRQVDRL